MNNIRWYDKNPNLKDVFEFIETLEKPKQDNIAQDILQILMNDFKLNLDEKINKINQDYNFETQRWYDKNIDLFTSFAIIKDFPQEVQNQIVQKIITSLLLTYFTEKQN